MLMYSLAGSLNPGLGKTMSATRSYFEGEDRMYTSRGNFFAEDMGTWDVVSQSVGLTSKDVAFKQDQALFAHYLALDKQEVTADSRRRLLSNIGSDDMAGIDRNIEALVNYGRRQGDPRAALDDPGAVIRNAFRKAYSPETSWNKLADRLGKKAAYTTEAVDPALRPR